MKRLITTTCLIAGLAALTAAPVFDAQARDDDPDVGTAVAAALLTGLVVSGNLPAPTYSSRHHHFAYVDHHGRRVYRDSDGHHFTIDSAGRLVLVRTPTDARFAYWDAHTGREVWRSCHRRGHRSVCSHFTVNRFGERVYLD